MRRSCALFLLLAMCLVPAADAKRKRRCAIRGGSVVLHDRRAVILSRDVAYSDLEDATEYYGCLRSQRRPFFVAVATRDQYGSSRIGPTVLRGTFFAYVQAGGLIDGSCRSTVTVYSLRGRDQQSVTAGGGNGLCPVDSRLLLTGAGLAAWVQSFAGKPSIRKLDHDGAGTLDSGEVDPASLRLTNAGIVTWTHAGEPRTATLR